MPTLGILAGAGIVLIAGVLQGVFAVPMKFARGWKYENIWLIFAASGLVAFPWLLTLTTVPNVADVYRVTSLRSLSAIGGFGVCWGVGAALTGLGLTMLGIGLGFAIILGLSASVGSLVPLLVLTPEKIGTSQGHEYLLGTGLMLIGIGIAARAGALREAAARAGQNAPSGQRTPFATGLLVAIAAGVLSSTLNFSYAFGNEALVHARALNVSPLWIANVITAPATTGGFFANLFYCVYLLRRNATSRKFLQPGAGINWLFGVIMGGLWFGGQALYGLGVSRMGQFGTVVGWPSLMGMIIVTSNVAGILTGEWKGAGKTADAYLAAGMLVILAALGVLALGQSGS
ncbi:MAG: L-rhamnose/proton symporter RhaT [Bryobacteraceae bacterium]